LSSWPGCGCQYSCHIVVSCWPALLLDHSMMAGEGWKVGWWCTVGCHWFLVLLLLLSHCCQLLCQAWQCSWPCCTHKGFQKDGGYGVAIVVCCVCNCCICLCYFHHCCCLHCCDIISAALWGIQGFIAQMLATQAVRLICSSGHAIESKVLWVRVGFVFCNGQSIVGNEWWSGFAAVICMLLQVPGWNRGIMEEATGCLLANSSQGLLLWNEAALLCSGRSGGQSHWWQPSWWVQLLSIFLHEMPLVLVPVLSVAGSNLNTFQVVH